MNCRAMGSSGSLRIDQVGDRGRHRDGIARRDLLEHRRDRHCLRKPWATSSSGSRSVRHRIGPSSLTCRRRPHHLIDPVRSARQHHQPVEAERDAAGFAASAPTAARKSSSSG